MGCYTAHFAVFRVLYKIHINIVGSGQYMRKMKSFRLYMPESRLGRIIATGFLIWLCLMFLWLLCEQLVYMFPAARRFLGPFLTDF